MRRRTQMPRGRWLVGTVVLWMVPSLLFASPPNIVLIMTDDAGYSDLGCYGGEMSTPNIDALAEGGIRFTKFYTNARCSPTRASLMTGQYPHRVGVGDLCTPGYHSALPGYRRSMSTAAVTVAEGLRRAGYHTLMSGKWHLGGVVPEDVDRRPRARGFDRYFGLLGGEYDYYDHRGYFLDDQRYSDGEAEYGKGFYATRAFTDYAVRFIRQAREKDRRPLFLYLAYTAPHSPHQAPLMEVRRHRQLYAGGDWEAVRKARVEGLRSSGLIDDRWRYTPLAPAEQERFDGREWAINQMRTVAAMSTMVDDGVGRIVDTFRELGELDNTLIVYLSDNGPDAFHTHLGAVPLKGAKHRLTEGGTATHCVLHWPKGIRSPGRVESRPGHVIDLMPTFLELAGTSVANVDGRSLVPVLAGEKWRGHKQLFWELYGSVALIEDGRWKYYRDQEGIEYLYDLRTDPTETVDRAASRPRKVRELAKKHQRWAVANNVVPRESVLAARREFRQSVAEKRKGQQRRRGSGAQ